MTIRKMIFATLALAVLAGCAPPVIVRFALGEQSAKLRYITSANLSARTLLWRVNRQQCPKAVTRNLIASIGGAPEPPIEKSQVGMFGITGNEDARAREMYIPAAEPFVFYTATSEFGKHSSCDNAGVFKPKRGRQYEINYVVEPHTFVCIVQVSELLLRPDGQVIRQREPSAHFFYPPKKESDYCDVSARAD